MTFKHGVLFLEINCTNKPCSRCINSTFEEPVIWELISAAKDDSANLDILKCVSDVNVEAANNHGNTLLILAAAFGNHKAVDYLINRNPPAYIFARSNHGLTAFIRAAKDGNLDIVQTLYNKDQRVIDDENDEGRTALFWAAAKGHTQVVKFLIQKGADTNKQDNHRNTAVAYASQNNHHEVVDILNNLNTAPIVTQKPTGIITSPIPITKTTTRPINRQPRPKGKPIMSITHLF